MLPRTPLNDGIGFALSRVIVPLWILTGVVMKVWAGTASNLPSRILDVAKAMQLDLDTVLYSLIGLEMFAILVMVIIARLARPMAIFMLSCFVLILLGELLKGQESCGCFGGTIKIEPWKMLAFDSMLLIGVVLFRTPAAGRTASAAQPLGMALVALVAGLGLSFLAGSSLHGSRAQADSAPPQGTAGTDEQGTLSAPDDPTVNPSPQRVPNNWYPSDLPGWVGKPWREAEIFTFMPEWPAGIDEGKRYVVFYSRTCAHCEEMFELDLTRDLGVPVVAIEIPASRTELTSTAGDAWAMPPLASNVTLAHLPVGPNWTLMTPPLALRIEDGVITCATEGDHAECFELR